MSLPVCCGVCAANLQVPKIMGVVCGILGAIDIFVPAIAGSLGASIALDQICEECGCSDHEREKYRDDIAGLGIVIAYFYGGFMCVFLGVTTLVLACCACGPCCGPLKRMKEEAAGGVKGGALPVIVGQPVGQPVGTA